MDYDKTEIATNDDKNSCSGASKRFSACRRQRHRAARSGGGDAGGSDGRGPQRDSDIRQTPRQGRKISRSRDPKSVEQAQPDLRGAGRGAQATFRDVTPGASINARSGRSFAVPGHFWKAAILPNPGFDANSQIRLDHAGSSDSAFVVICTICASRTHIPVIATRSCVGASGNRRAHVSRNFGGSIKFSVTFIALPYDLLNRGAGMTDTAGISGDRIRSFIERVRAHRGRDQGVE